MFYRSFVVFLEAIPHPQLIVSSLCGLLESFFALIGALSDSRIQPVDCAVKVDFLGDRPLNPPETF